MLWPLVIKLQLCKKVGGVADLGNFEKKNETQQANGSVLFLDLLIAVRIAMKMKMYCHSS